MYVRRKDQNSAGFFGLGCFRFFAVQGDGNAVAEVDGGLRDAALGFGSQFGFVLIGGNDAAGDL